MSSYTSKLRINFKSFYVKFIHFINVKYFNSTMSMYYMFSIQLTNCIWCLSHLFLLLLQSTTNQPNTPPPAVNVWAVRILLECIHVLLYFWLKLLTLNVSYHYSLRTLTGHINFFGYPELYSTAPNI